MKRNTVFSYILKQILFFCILLNAVSFADEIYSKNKEANSLYKQGKYSEALKLYDDALLLSPSDSKLKMNKGSALYKSGDYDKAAELYTDAISKDDKKIKADAFYNAGNVLFRQGEKLQMSGNPSAKEKYQAALQNYIQTLNLRPNDADAKWNLQLSHNRIKQVEQQQKQQQQNKNDKNKDNQNQNKQDQNKDNQNQNQKQDKNQSQDNKDQNQNNSDKKQNENQNKQEQKQEQQQQSQAQMQQNEQQKMKKDEARRLLELYSDDADSLNIPPKKNVSSRQAKPEQDW